MMFKQYRINRLSIKIAGVDAKVNTLILTTQQINLDVHCVEIASLQQKLAELRERRLILIKDITPEQRNK